MSSIHVIISDTLPNVSPLLEDESSYRENVDEITYLPTEILEIILENLTYDEISKIREVSRRFRDVGNEILNRGYLKILPNCLRRMYSLIEANELQEKTWELYGTEKVVKKDENIQTKTLREQQILWRCLCLLNVIMKTNKLLNSIFYRFIVSKDISPIICCSRSFFAGKIIDEIIRILKLVGLKTIEFENVDAYIKLVDKFINFFQDRFEQALEVNETITNRNNLFSNTVVDILECCLDCKKNVVFFVDSKDWCHFKGEYELDKSFFTCLSNCQGEFEDIEPLTVIGQRQLHECLRYLISDRNGMIRMEKYVLPPNIVRSVSKPSPCIGLAVSKDNVFFYGWNKGGDVNENDEKLYLSFKVEMKCRKDLAPLDIIYSSSSTEDEQCKVVDFTEDKDYDLMLRLKIICPAAGKENNRLAPVYRCLIKQKYLQEEPLQNSDVPGECVIFPLDKNSVSTLIHNNSNSET